MSSEYCVPRTAPPSSSPTTVPTAVLSTSPSTGLPFTESHGIAVPLTHDLLAHDLLDHELLAHNLLAHHSKRECVVALEGTVHVHDIHRRRGCRADRTSFSTDGGTGASSFSQSSAPLMLLDLTWIELQFSNQIGRVRNSILTSEIRMATSKVDCVAFTPTRSLAPNI